MFKNTKAFSGFSVDDIVEARRFYSETLGLRVTEEHGCPHCTSPVAATRSSIPRDHSPASYTILNFPNVTVAPEADVVAAVVDVFTPRPLSSLTASLLPPTIRKSERQSAGATSSRRTES